jgi:hypothetical protein
LPDLLVFAIILKRLFVQGKEFFSPLWLQEICGGYQGIAGKQRRARRYNFFCKYYEPLLFSIILLS